jgi:hypothetical protein
VLQEAKQALAEHHRAAGMGGGLHAWKDSQVADAASVGCQICVPDLRATCKILALKHHACRLWNMIH